MNGGLKKNFKGLKTWIVFQSNSGRSILKFPVNSSTWCQLKLNKIMKKLFVPTVDISYSHISKISIPRLSNHFHNYPSLHSYNSILVLVLSHFYYRSHLLTRCLSSSSASTLSQMFCNTDTWIFSHHYSDQGLSPSEGLVVHYSSGRRPFRPHGPPVVRRPPVGDCCSKGFLKPVVTNLSDLTDNWWLATTVL